MFTDAGPHVGLQLPQYLLEGQHSRVQAGLQESISDNFLTHVKEKPVRRDALLDLTLTKEEAFAGDVKVEDSTSWSDRDGGAQDPERREQGKKKIGFCKYPSAT